MTDRRVVVTGLGAITPIGLNVDDFWQGLISGKSGIGPITQFDTGAYQVKVGAEVKGFDPVRYMSLKRADRAGRCTQFAIAAAKEAVSSARLEIAREAESVGVAVATAGMMPLLVEQGEVVNRRGPSRIDPLSISRIAPSMVPAHVGLELGAKGPNSSVNSACASGNDALGAALNFIRLGHAEVMIAGGAEFNICPITVSMTARLGALSTESDPRKACRPFDLNRSGFVYGDGAGILVLENYEHAVSRGAPMLAELAGAGWSFDAFNEATPDASLEAVAMRRALENSGVSPQKIDYINAHGTGTRLNDATETRAIKKLFGEAAYRIPISSNKSMIGHMACAAGAVEAIATVKTILAGIIPPTINYETPDPECDLDCVPNECRRKEVRVVLSNSFGMGGQNCCIVLRRVE